MRSALSMATTGHRLTRFLHLILFVMLALSEVRAEPAGEPWPFDYYVLVLRWPPSYCATEGR
jgi:ribonuclease I